MPSALTSRLTTGLITGLITKVTGPLDDPILRVLVVLTFVRTLGRGVVLTLTVLYFTRVVGLSVGQIALVLTVANGLGVLASYAGGHLADRHSARVLNAGALVGSGVVLACYTVASSFWPILVLACLSSIMQSTGGSANSAMVARGFTGPGRVNARAVMRSITNLGIALGGLLAGAALAVDTAAAYRVAMLLGASAFVGASFLVRRLPDSVDAPRPSLGGDEAEPVDARPRPPYRDLRYVALTVLTGIFAMQFAVTEMGLALWVTQRTSAPPVVVSGLLILNTAMVVLLQVPLSKRTHEIPYAARTAALAGVVMFTACLVYSVTGSTGLVVTIALLVLAMVVHTIAELLGAAAQWGLSFELAPTARAGAYQGFAQMGFGLGMTAAPFVVTHTAIANGSTGWLVLGSIFLAAGIGTWLVCRHAEPHPAG